MGNIRKFLSLVNQDIKAKGETTMVQVKAAQLLDGYQVLGQMASQQTDARLALKIARIMKALAGEMDKIEAERVGLCQKHGTLPEGETNYVFEPEQREQFDVEIAELQARDVTLYIELLTLEELERLKTSGVAMMAAEWLVVPEVAQEAVATGATAS